MSEENALSVFRVTGKAMRPASNARECFYCHQPLGDNHKADCALIHKKVKVRMVIDLKMEVPSTWSKGDIEFYFNDGSWCGTNIVEELQKVSEYNGCLCNVAEFEYLGEDSEPYLDE